jgi:hypothetical protein
MAGRMVSGRGTPRQIDARSPRSVEQGTGEMKVRSTCGCIGIAYLESAFADRQPPEYNGFSHYAY